MARVLGQLFTITDLFDMQARPELVLLQKSMVLVEGVARALDPALDIWTIAEPVVGDWLRREEGPLGKIEDVKDGLRVFADAAKRVPRILSQAEAALADFHADKGRREAFPRWMLLALGWLALALIAVMIWRLATL